MRDPQHDVFVKRLKRVERLNRRGAAFEAAGTLGGSYYKSRTRKRSLWGPIMLAAIAFLVVKAIMVQQIGPAAYDQRITELTTGSTVEKVGAFVLQADPATVWLSEQIAALASSSQS